MYILTLQLYYVRSDLGYVYYTVLDVSNFQNSIVKSVESTELGCFSLKWIRSVAYLPG